MATVAEAIGLALTMSGSPRAIDTERDRFAVQCGKQVMKLLEMNLKPRDILTPKAFENAIAAVACTGGLSNAALHLPPLPYECGLKPSLDDIDRLARKTPIIADLKPFGRYTAFAVFEAGGLPA